MIFENLISWINKLITADEFLKIMRWEDVIIILLNRSTAKLDDILFMLSIEINLLFTQALLINEVENHQLIKKINFYQEDENIAKDSHEDKISYLIWIQNENALFNKSVRQINENICKNQQRKSVKSTKKQAQKINFENEKWLTKLIKKLI